MVINKVQEKFRQLRLKHCAENIEIFLERGAKKNRSPLQTINDLLDLEIEQRHLARINRCFKQSKLMDQPTIDRFDFKYHPSRSKQKAIILHLLDLEFIEKKMDVILIGNPGVGKSLLAKTFAYAMRSNTFLLYT